MLNSLVEFWKHRYGKITVASAVSAVGAFIVWFAKTRKAWHEGTAAKLEVKRLKNESHRNDTKDAAANYVRLHVGAVADDVAKALHIEIREAVALLMELEEERRVWHTNNGRWNFGARPYGF